MERVYLNPNKSKSRSSSAPPSKKSSFIDPYRKPLQETRSKDAPGWRPMTRMEAYTGRGLYSGKSKTKLTGMIVNNLWYFLLITSHLVEKNDKKAG